MAQTFQLLVEPLQVAAVVLEISQVEGVEVALATRDVPEPDAAKEHGSYLLSFAELAPLVISVAGAATGLLSLATAIMQYRTAGREAASGRKETRPPLIVIQDTHASLLDFSSPEELAEYLNTKIHPLPATPPDHVSVSLPPRPGASGPGPSA